MKLTSYLFCLIFCFSLSSCRESDEVHLNFKLEYENEPLVFFEDYNYPTGEKFQFQRISFFISDLNANSTENGNTNISEVEYLDLTNSHVSQELAQAGYDLIIEETGVESYDQLQFNIGLTEDQNSSVPEDFISSNPLSDSAEYWRSWESYIFFKIEGKFDLNGDGEYGAGEAFQLHLGTDDSMRAFSSEASSEVQNITIAVDKIFNYNGEIYDLIANPRLHSLTPEILASMDFLATGIEGAFESR